MAMINVNRQTNDMFYRYKMPKLAAKVEGTGNGIKTVLVNITAIAKALNRPPTYVTKFFGCELGAQVQMNAKEDRYIVNGSHDCEKLQNLLDGFIKRFVLCPNCDNPETKLSFRKRNGGEIHQVCAACGHPGTINMASHKLTTYIAKNPPDAETKTETPVDSKAKGKSKSKKNRAGGTNQDSDECSPNENDGKTNGSSKNGGGGGDDEDDEDWGDDLSPAVAELDTQIKGMIQTDDLDKPLAERCDQFLHLVEKKKGEQKLTNIDTIKDLLAEAERLEIMEQAAFLVAQCVFTDNILKEIDEYKTLLTKLCFKNAKGQKYLLHALEALIGDHEEYRSKIFNKKTMLKILLKLYDEDIVEEDIFYTWHEKSSKRFASKTIAKEIREMSNEFIQWLRTAEESSDEDEDEDNKDKLPEPQIDFSHTAGSGLEVKVEAVKKAPVEEKIEYNGEIIDVDNI
jgi:translation initiation factor 5